MNKGRKNSRYIKPQIATKKLKLKMFQFDERFYDSIDYMLFPPVYGQSCSCCFPGSAKIETADGKVTSIKNINKGDFVFSFNHISNKIQKNKVEKVIKHELIDLGYLIINGEFKVTPNHRIWVNNKKWERADNLKKGDRLFGLSGKEIEIRIIRKHNGLYTVYNLHLKNEPHNFFADKILVHNGRIEKM